MNDEKPGNPFYSVPCFAVPSRRVADASEVGTPHREAWADVDPDALSRFEGEGGSEPREPITPRLTLNNRNPAANELPHETKH